MCRIILVFIEIVEIQFIDMFQEFHTSSKVCHNSDQIIDYGRSVSTPFVL